MALVFLSCLHSVLKCICCPKKKPKPTIRRRRSATPQNDRGGRHDDALPSEWVDPAQYNGTGLEIDIEQLPTPIRGKVIQVSPGKFYRSTSQPSTPRSTSPQRMSQPATPRSMTTDSSSISPQRMSQMPPNRNNRSSVMIEIPPGQGRGGTR
jgi:hypothetical protein